MHDYINEHLLWPPQQIESTHTEAKRRHAQTDGDRSKNDHSGTTDELFGRVDTQQMEGQQWRRQIANPLPKKYQLYVVGKTKVFCECNCWAPNP